MPTIGQSISKSDLLARARDFQTSASANAAIPYQKSLKAENDLFIGRLQAAPDGNLSDIKACALKQSAALNKKSAYANWGGLGLMAAGWLAPIPGPAKIAAFVAGFALSQIVGGMAGRAAEDKREFASQLGEWQRSIDATSGQPAPAPAPAPALPSQTVAA